MPRGRIRHGVRGLALVAILAGSMITGIGQAPPLEIASASPSGVLDRLGDADQIRIVFSQAMVPLGTVATTAPPWIRITPAVPGSFYWSGTRTLIFSPDPAAPFPFATRFTVRVDASAATVDGRALAAPYELTFTTPAPHLTRVEWYRRGGRYDDPVILALKFNQPMRVEDVLAHAAVSLTPHRWSPPVLPPGARERLRRSDPAGLVRFDDKVRAVRRVTSSSGVIPVRAAAQWDLERFPPSPDLIVLETAAPPPTDAWLKIQIDGALRGAEGTETRPAHSFAVQLEPTFFVARVDCRAACDPAAYNSIHFTRDVALKRLTPAMQIVDVSVAARERPIAAEGRPDERLFAQTRKQTNVVDSGFPRQPSGSTWRVQLSADLEATDGQRLGYPWVAFISNAHARPFVGFDGDVWEASGGPLVPVTARNLTTITQSLTSVNPASVVPLFFESEQILRGGSWQRSASDVARDTLRRLVMKPDLVQTHGLDVRRLLSPGGTGLVAARVASRDRLRGASPFDSLDQRVIQVTNLGITLKESPAGTLVFVTRLDSGAPVADAAIAIVDGRNQTQWRGTTDRDGLVVGPALPPEPANESWRRALVTAQKDGDFAFVGSDWHLNTSFDHTGYGWDDRADPLAGAVFTDRGVYQRSDEVRFKAIVRESGGPDIALLPAGRALEAVIRDGQGREVDRRRIEVSAWSSADWAWRVPGHAPLGNYAIEVGSVRDPGDRESDRPRAIEARFLVAAYRRPDFRVEATLSSARPVAGTALRGVVEGKYLFGGALAGRRVQVLTFRRPIHQPPRAILERYPEERYVVGYHPDYGSFDGDPSSNEHTLDAHGRVSVDIPTAFEGDAALAYDFEGAVEDVSGQQIAGRTQMVVHPASFYITMSRPPVFVDGANGTTVGVAAVDLDGKPLADVSVTISLFREHWILTERPDRRGHGAEWRREEVPAGQWQLRTRAGETPAAIPAVVGGSYVLRAVARDASGRPTRTEAHMYSLGSGVASWRSAGHDLTLTPERTTWKPGETARILVQSPWPQATALVTVEREGIRRRWTSAITSTQDTIDVPIVETDAPNVFVSVLLVKGRTAPELDSGAEDTGRPACRVGYTELTVDNAARRLRIELSADREEYRPRDPLNVSVMVTDDAGRPVAGEVTLWAVDHALLSLTEYETPDVVEAIYTRQALRITTSDSRVRLMSRRPMADAPGLRAGVAGGVLGGLVQTSTAERVGLETVTVSAQRDATVRTDFRPVVLWLGSAETSADGRVATTVTLPDSLTTYRIMAVAGDRTSRFGFAEREVRVAKRLTLLPSLPRFLNAGDRASLGGVVTNADREAGEIAVTIQSLDPRLVKFPGATTLSVRLAPGESTRVTFDAIAGDAGRAGIRMTASSGANADGVEVPLTVVLPARTETTASYGETTTASTERISLRPGVLPGSGGLTVDLASTALVGLGESARYLDEYPFGCAEQKASRALALLLASDLDGAFRLSTTEPKHSRAAAVRALGELAAHQCEGGGFTLWPERCDAESTYLTAYVLHVIKTGERLGVRLDRRVVDEALDYLEHELSSPPSGERWWSVWAGSEAFAVKVLAEFGRRPSAAVDGLLARADRLPIFALSYVADALAASNDRGPRYRDVIRRLTNAVRVEADRAHVEELDEDGLALLWTSNLRATAVVLDGFARRKDDVPLAAPLVRWLLAARVDGHWGSTHENATALEALVSYYRALETASSEMTAAVAVGPETFGKLSFTGRSVAAQQIRVPLADLIRLMAASPQPGLSITRSGSGRLFYTARLQTVVPQPPEALDRGFHVERRYELQRPDGSLAPVSSFSVGDLVRVTVTVTVRGEGRYLALSDPLPAGFEPIDGWFQTSARDLARITARLESGDDGPYAWIRGYFDHVEKHDDRVLGFATSLAAGSHRFAYLVRATNAGTFGVPGARLEAMYAPELEGRSAATTVTVVAR